MGPRRLVAALAGSALVLSGCGMITGEVEGYELTAYFPRTINLFETSQVRVLGLEAGIVREIAVDGDHIRVRMEIDDDIPVPEGVRATIVPFSLIGERYVQLFPAWTEGTPRASDGDVIPMDRTTVPVEPDEALAALKEFLDSLDPEGTGRLVTNLHEALDGQGESINSALQGLSTTVSALASEDQALGNIIDQFDGFTATLATRESQLGEVMDAFAEATGVLAEERESIRALVEALGSLSGDGLGLVAEHGAALEDDLEILGRVLRSVDVNLERVGDLLDAGPVLVTGLRAAYNPEYHRIDLRTQYAPTVAQALLALGVPFADVVCVPVDVQCQPTGEAPVPVGPAAAPVQAQGQGPAPPVDLDPAPAHTPIDHIVALVGTNSHPSSALGAPPRARAGNGWWGQLLGSLLGVDW